MSEEFEPRNELERGLLAAQEGKIPGDVFMQQLLSAEVFMPVEEKSGIQGFQESSTARPLSVKDEQGNDVLILFTSPERAKSFVKNFPGFEGGMLAEFKWVLEKMGVGFGVALNPGWPVGIDMESDMVQELVQGAARGAQ